MLPYYWAYVFAIDEKRDPFYRTLKSTSGRENRLTVDCGKTRVLKLPNKCYFNLWDKAL